MNNQIGPFIDNIDKINYKFVLVSGLNDETIPDHYFKSEESFLKFINNEKLVHWYSQNCTKNEEKISPIPIGLDYHTLANSLNMFWGPNASHYEQEKELNEIRLRALPFWERKLMCYADFHLRKHGNVHGNGDDRDNAQNSVPKELVNYIPERIKRRENWSNQIEYAFVISPHGNGLDCHRTWEALVLGCIPIVRKSSIDPLYDNLPVLIVNEWSDVTLELLQNTVNSFKTVNFTYEPLLMSYWKNKIKQY